MTPQFQSGLIRSGAGTPDHRWMLQPVRHCAGGELTVSTADMTALVTALATLITAVAALVGVWRHVTGPAHKDVPPPHTHPVVPPPEVPHP